MKEIHEIIELVHEFPIEFSEYLTYNELIEEMDKCLNIRKIPLGKSSLNIEIFGYQIGEGKIRGFIYGLPHSDEPTGTLTICRLCKLFDTDSYYRENFSLFLIPCIDPDGLKLNEGWLKGEFNPRKFFLNRYHRPDDQDIDWSFPVNTKHYTYETRNTETKILMDNILKFQPDLFVTLHSIQFSGIHFYTNVNNPKLFLDIELYSKNHGFIPINYGTPFFVEEDWEYRPGFYRFYTTREMIFDYIREGINISTLRRGDFSAGFYQQNFPKGIALVPEVPLYYDMQLLNLEEGEKTKRETFLNSNKIMLEALDFIEPIWKENKKQLNTNSPHYWRIEEIMKHWRKEIKEEMEITRKFGSDKKATKSEIYSNEIVVKYNNCNILGTLHQLIRDSPQISLDDRVFTIKLLEEEIDRISEEVKKVSHIHYSKIDEMIRIQLHSILASLNYIKKKEKGTK